MEISSPGRIFCLGWPDSGVLTLLQKLTGSAPTPVYNESPSSAPLGERPPDTTANSATASPAVRAAEPPQAQTTVKTTTTTAGLSHLIPLRTKYYNADVTIWLDELPSPTSTATAESIQAWREGFGQAGAEEVVRAVGAWILVFRQNTALPLVEELLDAVQSVIADAHGGSMDNWDGVCLAVSMPSGLVGETAAAEHEPDEWDDICIWRGFEYIDGAASAQPSSSRCDDVNGHGQRRECAGIARIREALEANDWSAPGDEDLDAWISEEATGSSNVDHIFEGLEESAGFGAERREMEQEFVGFKMALHGQDVAQADESGDGDDAQVQQLESMMRQIQMVKDMSAHMSLAERKKFAAKAVNEMMKSI